MLGVWLRRSQAVVGHPSLYGHDAVCQSHAGELLNSALLRLARLMLVRAYGRSVAVSADNPARPRAAVDASTAKQSLTGGGSREPEVDGRRLGPIPPGGHRAARGGIGAGQRRADGRVAPRGLRARDGRDVPHARRTAGSEESPGRGRGDAGIGRCHGGCFTACVAVPS